MSWTRYLLHDFWTAREFNRIDDEERRRNRSQRAARRRHETELAVMAQRIDELEQDLGEATLLLRALADLCVEQGVVAPADLAAKAAALDALDGTVDGRMTDVPPAS